MLRPKISSWIWNLVPWSLTDLIKRHHDKLKINIYKLKVRPRIGHEGPEGE